MGVVFEWLEFHVDAMDWWENFRNCLSGQFLLSICQQYGSQWNIRLSSFKKNIATACGEGVARHHEMETQSQILFVSSGVPCLKKGDEMDESVAINIYNFFFLSATMNFSINRDFNVSVELKVVFGEKIKNCWEGRYTTATHYYSSYYIKYLIL